VAKLKREWAGHNLKGSGPSGRRGIHGANVSWDRDHGNRKDQREDHKRDGRMTSGRWRGATGSKLPKIEKNGRFEGGLHHVFDRPRLKEEERAMPAELRSYELPFDLVFAQLRPVYFIYSLDFLLAFIFLIFFIIQIVQQKYGPKILQIHVLSENFLF